jgi:hypothetical protein
MCVARLLQEDVEAAAPAEATNQKHVAATELAVGRKDRCDV